MIEMHHVCKTYRVAKRSAGFKEAYGEEMKKFTTFVIPYALVQYYPLRLLIGRSDRWYYALYPLGVLFFLAAAYAFWRFGVQHYTSAGS